MNGILEKLELIDIWRKLNKDKKKYTFFSAVHGTFTKTDHVLGHRNMANKCKKAEIIYAKLSDHNAMKRLPGYNGGSLRYFPLVPFS